MSDTVVLSSSPVAGLGVGHVVAGKYRLERELGRGAMGTVWSAMHTTLGQRVAIKLISSDQAQSPEARQRFGVEAKAAARLRSRHVVQVYDDGETPDGTPYIVMEYLEGETLEQRLDRQRDMGLAEAVRITSHVGRALARAHAQGVVHRDLKSGNIFIAKSDDDELGWLAKVLDFGVAKVLSDVHGPSATKTGTIVGTPLFMSPEQIRGASQVDQRADLYSLGMVFYNMVTGSHAFDGPSYSDVLVAICTTELPDIRVAAPWLPQALRAWFDKACARERDDRFQSADEMIDALQEASGPGARMSRPSVPEEIGGPSGTLVGYVPPHAAATLLAGDFPEVPGSASRAASSADGAALSEPDSAPSVQDDGHGERTTLRSNAPRPNADNGDAHARPHAVPALGSLWLWGAMGVGLAVAVMSIVVVTRSTPSSPATPLEAEPHAAVTPTLAEPPAATTAPAPSPEPPAATTAPAPSPESTPATPTAASPPAPTPSLPAPARNPPATSAARVARRHPDLMPTAATPARTAPARNPATPAPVPAPVPAPAVATPRPAPAVAPPDMGF